MTTQRKESAIASELLRLTRANGGVLQPESVVESAREETSPLHASFEWDDSIAAHQHRIWQARTLIRVVMKFEQVGNKAIECRVLVSLTPDRQEERGGYRLLSDVLADETMRGQLLADAKAEMRRFASKYRDLAEVAEVVGAIEEVLTKDEQPQDVHTAA